jgi:alkaline phosphatase D
MRRCFLTVTLCLLSSIASAAPLVTSEFNSNREGWSATFGAAVGIGAIWQSTGGNPSGNLVAPDSAAGTLTWYFDAAAGDGSPLLGNQSAAYGGSFEYDMKIDSFAGNYYNTASDFDVWLVGNGFTLLYRGPFQPDQNWNHFSVPLVASAGWEKNLFFPATTPASEAELQAALSNITELRIRGNYTDAATTTRLDNVSFVAVPEPASSALAAFGMLAILAVKRRNG